MRIFDLIFHFYKHTEYGIEVDPFSNHEVHVWQKLCYTDTVFFPESGVIYLTDTLFIETLDEAIFFDSS